MAVKMIKAAFVVFIFLAGIVLIATRSVNAEPSAGDWSWVNSTPIVHSSEKIENMAPTMCPNYYQVKEVDGYADLKKICLTMGDDIKFGTFYSDYAYRAAVGFKLDTKMYKVNGICNQYDNCLYLPDTDTLVTKQYLVNGIVRSLVVYKNFSARLKKHLKFEPLAVTEYDFDASNPDYTFKSNDTVPYAWPIGGFGASENGKWLAVEFRQRGVGLLNIETLEMKRVSNKTYSYNAGMNSRTEFAVSSDGRHIAIVGVNSGLTLYEVTDSCGDVPTDERMRYVLPVTNKCRTSMISNDDFIYRFSYAVQPSFDSTGAELRFFATSYVNEIKKVVLWADGYQLQTMDYLALGDSFTSGEGEESDAYYLNGTNDQYEKCHVSVRSYPLLIASDMNMDGEKVKNVACSGARTVDIVGGDDEYLGQNDRFGKSKMNLDDISKNLAQYTALNYFMSGRIHQESFVSIYKPKLITVGVGGNDVGFMDKIKDCIYPFYSCPATNDPDQLEQTMNEIKNMFYKLVEVYAKLHQDSMDTKIYAVGYPQIISQQACQRIGDIAYDELLDDREKRLMNEGVEYLNLVISRAAKAAGIGFLDVQDGLGNQVICGSASPSAVNAIRLGDDSAPYTDNRKFYVIGNEGFHPNGIGHSMMAGYILDQVDGNLLEYNYCSDKAVYCPDNTVLPPSPDEDSIDFWLPEGGHDPAVIQKQDIVFDKSDATDEYDKKLIVKPMSLQPGSTANLEIHSNPIKLGDFIVSSDGSLAADIVIPDYLEDGYHTYHLYGRSFAGEAVDIYQSFIYKSKPDISVEITEEPMADETPDNTKQGIDADKPIIDSAVVDTANGLDDAINDASASFRDVSDSFVIPGHTVVGSVAGADNFAYTPKEGELDKGNGDSYDSAVLGQIDTSNAPKTSVNWMLAVSAIICSLSAVGSILWAFYRKNQ